MLINMMDLLEAEVNDEIRKNKLCPARELNLTHRFSAMYTCGYCGVILVSGLDTLPTCQFSAVQEAQGKPVAAESDIPATPIAKTQDAAPEANGGRE